MLEPWSDFFWLFNRYLHIVASTLLVGGTLFYALVVPRGIDDLKDVSQIAVLARLRWVFRTLVYLSAIVLVITGALSWSRNNGSYSGLEMKAMSELIAHTGEKPNFESPFMKSGLWFGLHVTFSSIALVSSVAMIRSFVPPSHPIGWLRMSLIFLLAAVLLASMTRHSRLRIFESIYIKPGTIPVPASPE